MAKILLHTVSWNRTCNVMQSCCDIHPDVKYLPHPAAPLLEQIRRDGVPVLLATVPWMEELKEECFLRGPHKLVEEYTKFLQDK
jgi:hypothetical protein